MLQSRADQSVYNKIGSMFPAYIREDSKSGCFKTDERVLKLWRLRRPRNRDRPNILLWLFYTRHAMHWKELLLISLDGNKIVNNDAPNFVR